MNNSLIFVPAVLTQAPDITALINAAFRSEPSGQTWLTDNQDKRTDMLSVENVQDTLSNLATPILVGTAATSPELIAVCLLKAPGTCPKTEGTPAKSWLSMLAVDPKYHQHGYGSAILEQAEMFAREHLGASRIELNVVNARVELRAWYGKKGYQATGQTMEFPYGNHRDGLMAEGLELLVLGKDISAE